MIDDIWRAGLTSDQLTSLTTSWESVDGVINDGDPGNVNKISLHNKDQS